MIQTENFENEVYWNRIWTHKAFSTKQTWWIITFTHSVLNNRVPFDISVLTSSASPSFAASSSFSNLPADILLRWEKVKYRWQLGHPSNGNSRIAASNVVHCTCSQKECMSIRPKALLVLQRMHLMGDESKGCGLECNGLKMRIYVGGGGEVTLCCSSHVLSWQDMFEISFNDV